MATLQTIRNRGGLLVSIVIGLALVAFIVGDALSSGASIFNSKRNQVGEIAGEGISIIDFQNRLNKNESMVKMMNKGGALDEDAQNRLRENTWQQIVMETLMGEEYKKSGIEVSGEELYEMLLGDNMSPAVRQLFADANGNVDIEQARTVIRQLIDAPNNSPEKAYWLNMEEEIGASRKMSKYNALIAKSLYITDAQAQEYANNNALKSDISYIVKNYTTISDSSINVTPAEIKEYYNNNQKRFEQPESRRIVYVNFDVLPSADDYSETQNAVKALLPEFESANDPMEFVDLSSDKKVDYNFYKKEEISNDSLANFLFSKNEGVFGPYLENESYKITLATNVKMLPDSVRIRQIVIAPVNNNYEQTMAKADSLANLIRKGNNFEEMARLNSLDQNTSVNGGDLGWIGPRDFPHEVSDSLFFAKKNDVKVFVASNGAYILQVTDMSKPVEKVQIATVEKEVLPSAVTTNKIYNEARTFATDITDLKNFEKKVADNGMTKRMASVDKNEKDIAGMENVRDMIRQIYLTEAPGQAVKTNDGSIIFENDNKFTVAILTDINEEGIAPMASVNSNIRRILVQKKKAEMLKKDLESVRAGSESLLSVAQKLGLEVKEATDISFNSFQVPGAGIEPQVIAASSIIEQGRISAPIEGNQGVFLIMVNNRIQEPVSPDMEEEARQGLMQANMYRANYQAFQAILKNGNVKDLRYKFY